MTQTNPPISVAVTGCGGGGHGRQIIKALRLAETKYNIVGTDITKIASGLSEVDHAYLIPPARDENYLPAILDICKRHDVRALIHGNEIELKMHSANREFLEAQGLFLPINPRPVIDLCMDKIATATRLTELGFHVPKFLRVRALSDVETFENLPAVLKPSVGGGGSANLFLVQDPDELRATAQHLLKLYDEFILQEYVGTPEDEYTVGVLIDQDGQLLNSIAVRRYILSALSRHTVVPNRTKRTELGPTLAISGGISQGEIGPFPDVCKPCEDIALALGARGSINFQCRFVEGRVVVFEINPRFSGTTSLRAMVGYNGPDVLIRSGLLGEKITPHFPYKSGIIMREMREVYIPDMNIPFINGSET